VEDEETDVNFYSTFAQPAMIALARAGNRGVRVDVGLRKTLELKAEQQKEETTEKLLKILGHEVNPNSPKQVKELLYEELGLPEQHKRKVGGRGIGAVTSDEEAIKKLRRLDPTKSDVLDLLLDFRGFSKMASSMRTLLEEREGESYFVTSYNATGTTTGRISSSQTILGLGGNLQNQARGPSRRIFVPRKGYCFVKADASQAEARVVAVLMGDEKLQAQFADPSWDVHLENAQLLYGGTLEELREEDARRERKEVRDSRRRKTKAITHGANYKGGPHVVVKSADIPYNEAKLMIAKYRRLHPLLLFWWEKVEALVRSRGVMKTTWGRIRIFLGRIDEATFRAAVAHEPQSTVGDLINRAFFRLDARGEGKWWPLLQVHDEIVCEVRKEDVEEVIAAMREEFTFPMEGLGGLSIPVEVAVGDNWYDVKEI